MPRFAYRKVNGLAQDIRYVTPDYTFAADELVGDAEPLPSTESLSDPKAWAALNAPQPDVAGFIVAAKTALGGIVALANLFGAKASLVYDALQSGQWADAQALIVDAHTPAPGGSGTMNDQQYAALKALAAQHNIPVTLP